MMTTPPRGHRGTRKFRQTLRLITLAAIGLVPPVGRAANFYQGITNSVPWPGGIIPYQFDTSVTAAQQSVYLAGLREWELAANIHFVPRTNEARYLLLRFFYAAGQDNYIEGTPPTMTIDTLSRSQVGHEMGHALGFQHEHVRLDRDNFITVNFANIQTSGAGEQDTNITSLYLIDSNSVPNGPYDFESVMHYGRTLFSTDPAHLDVIVPNLAYFLKYYYRIGNLALSPGDRSGAAYLYGPPATPLTNIVTTTADYGFGSLRAAIYYANDHPGASVRFNIPTSDPGYSNGVFTIYLSGELPPLVADGTVIDGTTQPGFAGKPVIALSGAQLISEISFPSTFYSSGIHVYAADCTLRGLAFDHFPDTGVYLQYPFANSNSVEGCFVGVAPPGTNADGNAFNGVMVQLGASYNMIGGTNASQRNVIGGNSWYGIAITDTNTLGNTVLGNYIGLDAAGMRAVSNGVGGVGVWAGSSSNLIGGSVAGARNIISGNGQVGVSMVDSNTVGNAVIGNYIGTDATGASAVPNMGGGIGLFSAANHITVGGTNAAAGNVISGNAGDGIDIGGTNTGNCLIQGNYIGTDAAGANPLTNGGSGISIYGGANNITIGGTSLNARNLISGNASTGVLIQNPGTVNMAVLGNFIGLDASSSAAIPNSTGIGVFDQAQSITIGGTDTAARNFIAGNRFNGVSIGGTNTSGTLVLGNYIGVATDGTTALGNGGTGLAIFGGSQSNTIGGTSLGAGNLVAANDGDGIQLSDPGTSYNLVQGNLVGTSKTGGAALGNGGNALGLYTGPQFNTIGGTSVAARNLFSASTNGGVLLDGAGTANNTLQGNYIGTDASGAIALGNRNSGVFIGDGAQGNLIGGTAAGAGNVISANGGDGIDLYGNGTSSNVLQGNFVGTTATGLGQLGNGLSALAILSGAQLNTIGGTAAAARNLFSASTNGAGIYTSAASNNVIQGNYIGTDISGLTALTNGGEGLTLFGGSRNNQIGGFTPGAGNVIAASRYHGVFIADAGTSGNLLQGNSIGVGADGTTALGNGLQGIIIQSGAQNNVIGLDTHGAGAGNVIANSAFEGVILYDPTTTGNTIRGNTIFNNGALGLNLVGGTEDSYGVTANHPGGPASGPNDLQNYPLITSAAAYPNNVILGGSFNSAPGRSYLIDLYRNASPDPSGHGEGQVYLGSATLSTDPGGNGSFGFAVNDNVPAASYTATATDAATGDTSEYSSNILPSDGPAQFIGPVTRNTNGFSVALLLQTNVSYHIQAATNLASPINWSNLPSFVSAVSPYQFTDPAATNIPRRFYRVSEP